MRTNTGDSGGEGWASTTLARISLAVQTKGMASVFQWVRRNVSHSMLGS